jgi:hypothetical protein
MAVTSENVPDIAFAIYIGKNGEVVATERIDGSRTIDNNLRSALVRGEGPAQLLQVDVRVETREPGASGSANPFTLLKLTALRKCYDMSGNPIPCTFF